MSFDIQQIEKLTDADEQALFFWKDDVFNSKQHNLVFRDDMWCFAGFENERIVSHVGIVKHEILVGKQKVEVGGISSVATVPEAQGKGCASKMLERATGFMKKELTVDFGLLFCNHDLIPFYNRAHWSALTCDVFVKQPWGKRKTPPTINVMILQLTGAPWPPGDVDLQSLPW